MQSTVSIIHNKPNVFEKRCRNTSSVQRVRFNLAFVYQRIVDCDRAEWLVSGIRISAGHDYRRPAVAAILGVAQPRAKQHAIVRLELALSPPLKHQPQPFFAAVVLREQIGRVAGAAQFVRDDLPHRVRESLAETGQSAHVHVAMFVIVAHGLRVDHRVDEHGLVELLVTQVVPFAVLAAFDFGPVQFVALVQLDHWIGAAELRTSLTTILLDA